MKRFFMGIVAVCTALCFVYATSPVQSKTSTDELHWFQVDENQNPIPIPASEGQPPVMEASGEPFGCDDSADVVCAKGYSSSVLNSSQEYEPVGAAEESVKYSE